MSNSTSLLTYPDVKDIFDRALSSERGFKIDFKDHRAATRFVARANSFRLLDRKENLKIYQEGHTLHGRSQYDVLKISRTDSSVFVVPIVIDESAITEL